MKKYGTLKITVPNDASYLPIVQLCAREVAKKFGFDEGAIKNIELGIEETFMNVIEHAFEADEENYFDIIYKQNPRGIEIIVKEQGMPFDPNRIPNYMPTTDIDTASVSVYWFSAKWTFICDKIDKTSWRKSDEKREAQLHGRGQSRNPKEAFIGESSGI